MNADERLCLMAFARMMGYNYVAARQLLDEAGSATAIYEHRNHPDDIFQNPSTRLRRLMGSWDEALQRSLEEQEFALRHGISIITIGSSDYPQRLMACDDAPLVLYYLGTDVLNRRKVVSIVGTRHMTDYGRDLIEHFVGDLSVMVPDLLVVSGLAYGVDICAHRAALAHGLSTVGVLAHGLDDIYPSLHRDTARTMTGHGGLLTEHMTRTQPDKKNFVKRNRIVAGMADATVLIESAARGGGLITCGMANDYGRMTAAFPGPVNAEFSRGCNHLIRQGAQLLTSAEDFVETMGWDVAAKADEARAEGIERTLFPQLDDSEKTVVRLLKTHGDLQVGQLAALCGNTVAKLNGLLFNLEMKGVLRQKAGGLFHLLT